MNSVMILIFRLIGAVAYAGFFKGAVLQLDAGRDAAPALKKKRVADRGRGVDSDTSQLGAAPGCLLREGEMPRYCCASPAKGR